MRSLERVIIGIALVFCAPGASSAEPTRACTGDLSELLRMVSCEAKIHAFFRKMTGKIDLRNETVVADFKASCNELDTCRTTIGHCAPFGTNATDIVFNIFKTFCAGLNYVVGDLQECLDKTKNYESSEECDFHPFGKRGETKDPEKLKERCKNFFGKNQCMKTAVIKSCGQEEWEKFRDIFINMNNAIKKCDLSGVV